MVSIVLHRLLFHIFQWRQLWERDYMANEKYHIIKKNIEKRSSVFWNTVIFRCITTFIATVVYMIFIKTSGYDGAIYSIMVCNILVVAVDISWFFQGMEEFKKIAIRDAIFKIFSIVLIFAFVKESTDLILYIVLMLGVSIMSAFSVWTYVPTVYNGNFS